MNYIHQALLYSCLFLGNTLVLNAQSLSEQLMTYNTILPQEKGHIHTDRTFYKAGDDIWFSAYFLKHDLSPSDKSHYIRAELVAPSGTVEESILLEYKKDGMVKGDFKINPKNNGGLYKIRMQSNWMLQVADTQYIEKTLMVQEVVYSNILMEVDFDQELYGAGNDVKATIKLRDLYDNAIRNKKVACSIMLGGKLWQSPSVETDYNGLATLQFTLPKELKSSDGLLTFKLKHDELVESVSKAIPLLTTNVDVQFLPEGGTIVEGEWQKMAFIAVDELGVPVDVKGIIVDDKQDTLSTFTTFHNGMGSFEWLPAGQEKQYTAIITEPYGLNDPIAINWESFYSNIGLNVSESNDDSLQVTLLSSEKQTITLILQAQGEIYHEQQLDLKKGKNTHYFATKKLPIGIAQITVLDANQEPRAERLAFLNKHKQLNISVKHKNTYLPREKAILDITITDQDSMPVEGLFSIAVVNEKNIVTADDKQANLLSNMLLTNDLKGAIQDPNFYFEKNDSNTNKALDYVMLTHGWRRFDWDVIQRGTPESWQQGIKVLDDKCYVKGIATVNGMPLAKQKVLLESSNSGSWKNRKDKAQVLATTNSKGEFFLENATLDFPCYLSTNYRGIPTNANMHAARTGQYTCSTIQSDVYNPSASYNLNYPRDVYTGSGSGRRNRRGGRSIGGIDGNFTPQISRHTMSVNNLTGEIYGTVQTIGTEEPLPFANVVLHQNGEMIRGTATDWDGVYRFTNIEAGDYTMVVSYVGMESYEFNFTIRGGEGARVVVELAENVLLFSNSDGSLGVATVNANVISSFVDQASVGASISRINRSFETTASMRRSSKGKKAKPKKRNKKTTPHNLMRKRSVKPAQSTEAIYQGSLAPYNRYHVANSTSSWRAEAVVQFDVTAVRVLDYYRARQFYAPKHIAPKRSYKSDFRQTLYWDGIVQTNKEGKAQLSYYNSDEISTYRVMIEGIGNQQIGRQETTYYTKEPVELRTRFPNIIAFKDTVTVPLVLKNNSEDTVKGHLNLRTLSHHFKYDNYPKLLLPNSTETVYITMIPNSSKQGEVINQTNVDLSYTTDKITIKQGHQIDFRTTAFPRSASLSGNKTTQTLTFEMNGAAKGLTYTKFVTTPNPIDKMDQATQGLLREPHGCFEQVSSSNFPNILVLKYMDARGIDDLTRREKALAFLEKGYAKLASYETKEAGFEWFGKTPPHLGLTAYGLIQFHEMKSVYPKVSTKLMGRTKRWILRQKDGNGGFKVNKGRWGFSNINPAINNAYALYALSVVGEKNVKKELEKATEEALKSKDLYRLGLMMLTHLNYKNKRIAKQLLEAYVEKIDPKNVGLHTSQTSITNSYGQALTIEVLSIGVLAMYQMNLTKHPLLKPMVEYIAASQKNGRYGNTQSTIWALKALTTDIIKNNRKLKFSEGTYAITVNGHKQELSYSKENNQELLVANLEKWFQEGQNTITVDCEVKKGIVPPFSLDVDWYNTMVPTNDSCQVSIETTLSSETVQMGETVRLTAYISNKTVNPQASTIAKIGIPTGLSLQPWQIQQLQEQEKVDYIELMDDYIVLHYRDMQPNEEHVIHLDLKTEFAGTYQAAASSAYLYYHDEQKHWARGIAVKVMP